MSAEKVRLAFCLTLPFCLTFSEIVRQFPKVRQNLCLTFSPHSTPINKGYREKVRQLGQLETEHRHPRKGRGGDWCLPNFLISRKNSPNSLASAHQKGPTP